MRFIRLNCFRRSPIAIWMRIVILIMRLIASVLLHAHAARVAPFTHSVATTQLNIQMARLAQLVPQLMNPARESALPLSLSLLVLLALCLSLSVFPLLSAFLPSSPWACKFTCRLAAFAFLHSHARPGTFNSNTRREVAGKYLAKEAKVASVWQLFWLFTLFVVKASAARAPNCFKFSCVLLLLPPL